MNKLMKRIGNSVAALALMVTALNVNSTCFIYIHQPKLPQGAEKLKRIK